MGSYASLSGPEAAGTPKRVLRMTLQAIREPAPRAIRLSRSAPEQEIAPEQDERADILLFPSNHLCPTRSP